MNKVNRAFYFLGAFMLSLFIFSSLSFAETIIDVSGNGAGSTNSTNVSGQNSSTTNQSNTSNVNNNVNVNCNTGGNSNNNNSGGSSSTTTGDCSANVNIQNNLNSNQANVPCSNCPNATPSPVVDPAKPIGGSSSGGSSSSNGGSNGGTSNSPQILGSTGVLSNTLTYSIGFALLILGLWQTQKVLKLKSY